MANHCVIKRDAVNKKLTLSVVNDSGVVQSSYGEVSIDLADLVTLGAVGSTVKFRELRWKDATTCIEYKAAFLMTEPVAS